MVKIPAFVVNTTNKGGGNMVVDVGQKMWLN